MRINPKLISRLFAIPNGQMRRCILILSFVALPAVGHTEYESVDAQIQKWLDSLGKMKRTVELPFDDDERYNFRWVPAFRKGVALKDLSQQQKFLLTHFFKTVLSVSGQNKIDAILATEAALGVLSNSPDYRDTGKYYAAVFGKPGPNHWGLRFEGHHLSINLTFQGSELISATPLFLGANPETIPSGPDQGLRALQAEVDQGKKLFELLTKEQRQQAMGSNEWFSGFITDAGSRRADLGKPAGILATDLTATQQRQLQNIISAYVSTINNDFATIYLKEIFKSDWQFIRFFWKGNTNVGENFYYRIAGKQLFIEHDAHAGASHVHAIWRDAKTDFGGL